MTLVRKLLPSTNDLALNGDIKVFCSEQPSSYQVTRLLQTHTNHNQLERYEFTIGPIVWHFIDQKEGSIVSYWVLTTNEGGMGQATKNRKTKTKTTTWPKPNMEFVTNSKNGTFVKYFWPCVKFSRISAKNYPFCEICPIQAWFFIKKKLKWLCIWVEI